MKLTTTLASFALSAMLLIASLTGATAANAQPLPTTGMNASCVAQVKALGLSAVEKSEALKVCSVTQNVALGMPRTVSTSEILADKSLSASAKADLVAAAAAATVSSRNWSQFTTGAAYTVTHGGKFFYNGTRVWATVTYAGYTGSHNCVTNYAVGFTIAQRACSESGSTTSRAMYNSWTVGVLVQGSPVSYDVSMTANLSKTGGVTGFGTSAS